MFYLVRFKCEMCAEAGGQGIWVCDKYVRGTDNFR